MYSERTDERLNGANSALEVVDEIPELRPSVSMEIRAKIDCGHPDVRRRGLTLAAEERIAAREWEIGRTRERDDRAQDSIREQLCRRMTANEYGRERCEPEDPLAGLDGETRRVVGEQAGRLAGRVRCSLGPRAVERLLAERVVAGCAVPEAVLGVLDDLYEVGGAIVPLGRLEAVERREVDVEGVVEQLWEPSHPAIQQVGLLADDSGRVKVTVWAKSDQPWMAVGERVRVRCAAKSWYNGRVSVSLTSRSSVVFPESAGRRLAE